MTVLKNALANVVRNKGRNILMILVVTVITAAATIGLAILQAAQNAQDTELDKGNITAQITLDRQAIMQKARQDSSTSSGKDGMDAMRNALQGKDLTLEDYKKYDKETYGVSSTYYVETSSASAVDDDVEPVSTSSSESSDSSPSSNNSGNDSKNNTNSDASTDMPKGDMDGGMEDMGGGMGGGMGGMQPTMTNADFTLVGFSSDEAVKNAPNGSFTMDSGSVFSYDANKDNEAIISKTLADLNNLKVGDSIKLANPADEDKTFTLKVTGIYSNTSENQMQMGGPMASDANDPANAIYVSVSTLKNIGLDSASTMNVTDRQGNERKTAAAQLSYTYVFANKSKYEQFVKDVKANGLSSDYTVRSTDMEQYEASLVPINNLAKFARTLLIVVLLVGALVLVILTIFNIRERKYEIGVLTAIGMRKSKVAAQFTLELLTVTLLGLMLGTGIGAATSAPVSNELLSSQVAAQQSQEQQNRQQFGRDMQMPGKPGEETDSTEQNKSSNDSDGSKNNSEQPPAQPDRTSNGMRGAWENTKQFASSINASVNWMTILWMLLIGLGLTLVSALVAAIFVMRYEPLQILADRS